MKNERAIEVIKNYVGCYLGFLSSEEYEAMELAIDALEENVIRISTIEEWKKDFKEYVDGVSLSRDDYKGIMEYIDEVPTVETDIEVVAKDAYKQGYTDGWKERFGEPNERPQGEWLFTEIDENYHVYGQCSVCKERNRIGKFCRSCGADMRGKEK